MIVAEAMELAANLEEQTRLFSRLLYFSGQQLELLQVDGAELDVEALSRLSAERQNLIERIDVMEEVAAALRGRLAGSCGPAGFRFPELCEKLPQEAGERLGKAAFALREAMQALSGKDRECAKLIRLRMGEAGARLKSVRVGSAAAQVYQKGSYGGGGNVGESRFMDSKK